MHFQRRKFFEFLSILVYIPVYLEHNKVHENEMLRGCNCSSCSNLFKRQQQRKNLKNSSYQLQIIERFNCSHCSQFYMNLENLKEHEKVHAVYSCHFCFGTFNTWIQLEVHERTHRNERNVNFHVKNAP